MRAGASIFAAYLLVMIFIGLVSTRYQRNTEDFWVAGRRFGLGVMVIAMMASVMHGGSILSGIGIAARFGGAAILPFASFAIGIGFILLFFAKKLRQMRGYTLPDFMGDRFDSAFLRGFSALMVAISSVVYIIGQIRVMGFVLQQLLGVSATTALILGTTVFVFYVVMGGMLAVVWTEIAQFLFMWLGLFIIAPGVLRLAGGWSHVVQRVNEVAPGWTSVRGTSWTWTYLISWHLVWLIAYATRVALVSKIFAARDTRVARFALPLTVLLVMIFLLYGNFYLGAAARITVWENLTHADQAFPKLVSLAVGPWLAAFALTGLVSAAMSTTSTLLLVSGAAVAHDFLRRCIHQPRGIVKSEKYYLAVSRLSILVVGMLALYGALHTHELILVLTSYAVTLSGVTFFIPLLTGLQFKQTSKASIIASVSGGVSVSVLWMVLDVLKSPWAQRIHPGLPGMLAAIVFMLVVQPFTRPVKDACVTPFFPSATSTSTVP